MAPTPPPPPKEGGGGGGGFDDFEDIDDGAGDYYFRGEEDDDDDDDDYDRSGGRRNNDRSPLNTLKKKNSVIRTMKMVSSSFKGLKKSPKHQEKKDVVLFDSYPSLDFDVNNLDDTAEDDDGQEGNEQQQNDDHDDQHADDENGDTKEQSEQEKDIDNGHGDVDDQGDDYGYKHGDRKIPAQVDEMAREASNGSNRSSSRSSSNRSNGRSDRKRDIGHGDEQQNDIDDKGNSDTKPHAIPSHQADGQKEHHRRSSEVTTPKPPRPRKTSSLVKVPPAPQLSPPTSSKRSPLSSSSSSRKSLSSSSIRKRSSGGGSSNISPVKTSPSKASSPGSNTKAHSPRVTFQNSPPFSTAESPTASTKSSVTSSAVGVGSSLPNNRQDHSTTSRNGGVEGSPTSNKSGTEESWKRLSDAFAKTDGCMDGYFSKLQEKAGSAVGQDDDNEDPARLDRKEKGGTKSRIKKLFSLAKSPKSSSSHKPKPKNVAQKLQSDDPNVVMEELTSMLSPGHTSKSNISPPNRTKSLKLQRPIDDEKSDAPSVEYPEIPTERIISLNDIRKDVTSNAPESSDYIVKPLSVGSLDPNEVSWRRERTLKKTTSEYKSSRGSPGARRSDPYRRSTTRIHASRRIRSSSDDGLDSSGKSRRTRSSSNDGVDRTINSGPVASAPGEGFDSPGKARRKRSSSNDGIGSPDKPRRKRSSSNDGMDSSGNPRRIRSSSNDGIDRKPRSRRTFKIGTKNEDDSGRKDASGREKAMSRRGIKIENKDEGESTEAEISSSGRDKPRSRRTIKADTKESNELAENEMDSSGREKPISRRAFKVDKDEDESAEAGMNSSGREKAKSRRTIKIDEKHRDEIDENGSPRKKIEASGPEKSSTSTPHRRHRTSKLHDKPSPRENQEGKPSEHSHSSRRRHGARRSSANDDADDAPPTPNETAGSSGLRRKASRRVESSGTENGNTASRENDQLSKSKSGDHPNERPDSSGKTHSGRRQHGSSGSFGRRSLVHHDANATSKISASSHSKRHSNETSPERRHRPHGHRKSGAREATDQSDIKSSIFADSDRGTPKSSPMTKLKSIFTDDMALDYSHTEGVPHPIEKPDQESAPVAEKVGPRNFSSPSRSKSTTTRPDLRSGLVRSFSLNNMGRSASMNPFGGKKRWSQLDSLEEQSIDGSSLVEPSSDLVNDATVDKLKSSSEHELPVIHNTGLRSDIENGSQIDDEYEDELAPLKEDVPRSSVTLGEALDRGSKMHGRLFDDDGQQTVITDDGSLWLNEDGTDAVSKIRSSASVCAPQLDFGAPAGVRNVQ